MKSELNSNPISANIFCADPTCIEHEGRLYVYGTNDNQQFEENGIESCNTYEKIKSLVCFSTDDMCNWTYHGIIDVEKIAPWILGAWAPVLIKRKEKDGLTHFYLYFSNNGCGVGVLTSTSPLGPWTSPLKKALINFDMKALHGISNPFHPGVCLDDKGDAYLVCGGGYTKTGNDFMPGTVRIVRLGSNLISLATKFHEIKAPYFFENNEIYYINGTYIYSYNNNWTERRRWDVCDVPVPSPCSISYMTSKKPLDTESWKYKGHYFLNPGEQGLNYGNNNVYFYKFRGKYYLFYHCLALQKPDSTFTGYRSICVDEINVDEKNIRIDMCRGTKKGVEPVANLNPFDIVCGTTVFNCENIFFKKVESHSNESASVSLCDGAWTEMKNVDFDDGAEEIFVQVQGSGKISVFVDCSDSKCGDSAFFMDEKCNENKEMIAEIECHCEEYSELSVKFSRKVEGVHRLFFVFHPFGKDSMPVSETKKGMDSRENSLSAENALCLKNWTVK